MRRIGCILVLICDRKHFDINEKKREQKPSHTSSIRSCLLRKFPNRSLICISCNYLLWIVPAVQSLQYLQMHLTILALRSSEIMLKSSFWNFFKSQMYIYFLKAHEKTCKVIHLHFVSGYSFSYANPLNWANFDLFWTDHFCVDKLINNIYRIYIQLSLICDQSQLSSSIRLEKAGKSKWGASRDPVQFPHDPAERSTNFPPWLRAIRKNCGRVGALNCDASGIFLWKESL